MKYANVMKIVIFQTPQGVLHKSTPFYSDKNFLEFYIALKSMKEEQKVRIIIAKNYIQAK